MRFVTMKMQLQQWSRVCNPILPTIQLHPPKPTLSNPILHHPLHSRRHNLTLFDETIPLPPPSPFQSRIPACTSQSLSLASRPTRTDVDKIWFMYVSYDAKKVIESFLKASLDSQQLLLLNTTIS
jgi:hypothetical protein